ncbi:MAG: hypothetical protein MJ182_06520 [Treponema sp.]|nr:hypothetical protein [Treponema sp.]
MKLTKLQKIFAVGIIALIILLGAAFTAISIASYKPTVAFYNVSEKVQKSILAEITSMPYGRKGKNSTFNVLVLDSERPLSAQKNARKAKLIFATMDYDVRDFAKTSKVKGQDIALIDGMPSTTRATALVKDNKLLAVPVLYDFYEMDIYRPAFDESGVKKISEWPDFVRFLELTTKKDFSPLIFNGGLPLEVLNVTGCMVEALSGKEDLINIEEKLYRAFKTGNAEKVTATLEDLLKENKGLEAAIKEISKIYQASYINNSTFAFTPEDTMFFLDHNLCNSAFLTLSQHRNIDQKIINSYTSIYVPGLDINGERNFASPTVCALSLKNTKQVVSTIKLISSSRQSSLSAKSGLAPVQANCGVPDSQADDVRFWIAASNGPVMPMAAALPSAEMQKTAADWLILQFKTTK